MKSKQGTGMEKASNTKGKGTEQASNKQGTGKERARNGQGTGNIAFGHWPRDSHISCVVIAVVIFLVLFVLNCFLLLF